MWLLIQSGIKVNPYEWKRPHVWHDVTCRLARIYIRLIRCSCYFLAEGLYYTRYHNSNVRGTVLHLTHPRYISVTSLIKWSTETAWQLRHGKHVTGEWRWHWRYINVRLPRFVIRTIGPGTHWSICSNIFSIHRGLGARLCDRQQWGYRRLY